MNTFSMQAEEVSANSDVGKETVTIVVIGYNGDRWLPRCLVTLKQASKAQLRLCIVDNHNNPCIPSIDLASFDYEVLITPRRMGFAEANNFALINTKFTSDFIVFLNQDTISGPGWIDEVVHAFRENDDVAVISPGLKTYDLGQDEPNLVDCLRDSGLPQNSLRGFASVIRGLKHVTAAAMVIRGAVLREVGPFDPIFGSYYEDFDLCRRVRDAGYGIGVCPRATVGHFQGSVSIDPKERRRRERILIRNRLLHAARQCQGTRIPMLMRHVLMHFPRNLLRGVIRTPSSQRVSATLGAHWDLLKIAPRLISSKADQKRWRQALVEIGWNTR